MPQMRDNLPSAPVEKEMIPGIEEYAQEILSCTDPKKVMRLFSQYAKDFPDERTIALHKKVAKKLVWAIKHPDMVWAPNTEQHGCGCVYGKHRCTDRKDGWQKDKDWDFYPDYP
jgi:hypothetical protein